MEIWKDIKGYEGVYQVSNLGKVKSLERKRKHYRGGYSIFKDRILKGIKDKDGYLIVTLHKEGKQKTEKIHQLVAIAFLNHKPSESINVIDHINNIKNDNRLENLQIVTQRQNITKLARGKSKYVGVTFNNPKNYTPTKAWVSRIVVNGERKHLGYFNNEYDAHLAYQKKLKSLSK